jgi:hypothetical protein
VEPPDRFAVAITALEADDLGRGMAAQQPDQLGADVAGRADDADADPLAGARPAVRRYRSRFETRAHGRVRPLAVGRLEEVAGIGWTAVMTA